MFRFLCMTILLLVNYNNYVQSELQAVDKQGGIDYNLDFYGRVRQFLEQKLSDANVKVREKKSIYYFFLFCKLL